tara:strand:- start:3072 stop:3317 length:246 start_codon:yes stop_codon:yes gene_type:complete
MPKRNILSTPIQQAVYNYMADNNVTYDDGAVVFGFGTRQAFHMYVNRNMKKSSKLDEGVALKLKELGVEWGEYEDEFDELD